MPNAFHFDNEQFSRLFPFFIRIGRGLHISSVGSSLQKLCGPLNGENFTGHFCIPRPHSPIHSFADLEALEHQLVVLENTTDKGKKLRGQFEYLANTDEMLFVGSPWLSSMEQVQDYGLLIDDFARHDPLIDLLHVLKTQEITNEDLKALVTTINIQKGELKKANKEIHDIALFPRQNPDPLVRINFEGDILLNNPAAAQLDFLTHEGQMMRNDAFFKLVANLIDKSVTRWAIEAACGDRFFSFICVTMMDEGYINIYGRDITEKKKNEDTLTRLSLVASANQNAVLFTNVNGFITWANEAFCHMTGYAPDEIIGRSPVELCRGPLTDQTVLQQLLDAFFRGETMAADLVFHRKDQSWFWGNTSIQPLKDKSNVITEFFGIIQDVTAEKDQEEKMKVLSQIAEDNINAVIIADKDGRITWTNKSFTTMTGYAPEEVIGKKPGDLLQGPETDRDTIAYLGRQISRGEPFNTEIINYTRQGEKYWLRIQGQAIKNSRGEITGYFALEEDITREKESERRFRKVLESIGDNVWEHDFSTGTTYFSKSYDHFLGYSTEELTNNQLLWWNGVHQDDLHLLEESDRRYRNREADSHNLEYRIIHKDGSIHWVLDRGVTIARNLAGEPLRIVGTHTDITAQKKLEAELIKSREHAEMLARTKETFLANMSHEIRTPMNAIMGMSNQLAKTALNTQQAFYLNTINTAAENLLVIINDILDLSKIEAGKLTVEQIAFEPAKVIDHARQVLLHKAEEKGLTLTCSVFDASIAPVLIGDPYRLNQVMLNLISNAIKFTEKGGVDIQCKVVQNEAMTQTLEVTLADTGIGMEPEFVERLFDKFSQEYESVSRKYGGTGLGMSICKELVELMGGTMAVRSNKGEGSTISFCIPFAKGAHLPLAEKTDVAIREGFLKGKRIMVADDNDMNRLVAATILENYGAVIQEAVNGRVAVMMALQAKPDLILMDIQMPEMNGYEATRQLRKEQFTMPIVALTANAIRGEQEKCLKAGMNDYVTKPFKEEDLLRTLMRYTEPSENRPAPQPQASHADHSKPAGYSLDNLNAISRGNEAFVRKMLQLFIDQAPATMQKMQDALAQGDSDEISKLAHRLKPSLHNLGMEEAAAQIRTIEKDAAEMLAAETLSPCINDVATRVASVVQALRNYLGSADN